MPNKKEITLAKYAGFCYGVKRAVDSVRKLKSENPESKVCVLGELIHNTQVIEDLKSCGIETISDLSEKGSGFCVVRTHGLSPKVIRNMCEVGFEPYDLTCPDVKKVQQKAIELVKDGYYLVIVGKAEHPEVVAIKANAEQYGDKVIVVSNVEELKQYDLNEYKKIGVVIQTTQTVSVLTQIVNYLTPIAKELFIANTICPSTSRRQNEVIELAKKNDLIVIVGSTNSANTSHLADISKKYTETIHIESSLELKNYEDLINKSQKIGVSAGASTPQYIIDDVIKKLSE